MGIPGVMAYVVGSVELIGGIALMLGLATRVAATLMVPIMLGAIYFIHFSEGLLRSEAGAGYELNLILMAACILLGITGSNYLSVDRLIEGANTSTSTNVVSWLKENRK